MKPIFFLVSFFTLASSFAPLAFGQNRLEDFEKLNEQYYNLAEAHKPAIAEAAKSTVGVLKGDTVLSLGSIVRPDGWILTKRSEVIKSKDDLTIHYGKDGKSKAKGRLVKEFPKMDLVLIKIDAKGLTPMKWYTGEDPVLGSFLATPGYENDDPIAIGVLSVKDRSLDESERGFLGVSLDSNEDGEGILVSQVITNTAAMKAGMKDNDIILEMDGKPYDAVPDFIEAVGKMKAGTKISLKVRRGDEILKKDIKLGKRPRMGNAERQGRFDRMNRMGTELSEVLAGFPSAIQHDLPLDPEQCGGPLCDLNGHVLGINIARAGRIKTYAIPGRDISEMLKEQDWKALASAPKAPPVAAVPPKNPETPDVDFKSIRAELLKMQNALSDARKDLERAEAANEAAFKKLKLMEEQAGK